MFLSMRFDSRLRHPLALLRHPDARSRRPRRVVSLLFPLLLAGSALWQSLSAAEPTIKSEADLGKVPEDPAVKELQRGSELAHQFCTACHIFPEPELLDKRTWATGALRKMAPFLGVAQIRFEGRPDGARLAASPLFPRTPWLTQEEWHAIQNFYLRSAPETALPQSPRTPIAPQLELFSVESLRWNHPPLTTMVRIDSSAHEVRLGDAGSNGLEIYDSRGLWRRSLPLKGAAVNLVQDGGRTLATLIGHVFPSDVPEGKVIVLPAADATGNPVELLSTLERPTDCVVADLNGDGRTDLLVCSFGNFLGRLAWYERTASAGFIEHVLLEKPGAIRAEVRDVNGDGKPDIIVLMAQGDEGVWLFTNLGNGEFGMQNLLRFHSVWGSTSFELADMNGDGFPDLILTNGDNGEYPSPFKRYHGVRIFLNNGRWEFNESWFYPLNGAFKVLARDFDGDGDLDLAVISFFADYTRSPEEGFVYFRNDGGMKFTPQSMPEVSAGRWLTMDAGDLDGDGSLDLVLGSFCQGPPGVAIPPQLQANWQTNGVAGLILRNKGTRPPHPATPRTKTE